VGKVQSQNKLILLTSQFCSSRQDALSAEDECGDYPIYSRIVLLAMGNYIVLLLRDVSSLVRLAVSRRWIWGLDLFEFKYLWEWAKRVQSAQCSVFLSDGI